MVNIKGTIEDIVFRNDENGFTVIDFQDEDQKDLVTVVGVFPVISIGERVALSGEWTDHRDYGRQFKMVSYSSIGPSDIIGMENYLASGLIRGVGPATAKKLVEYFGMDALDIIQFNPQRLTEVDGIGKARAEMIASSFEEQKEIREIMIFLQGFNITPTYALKIYKIYGGNTINIIKENPYRLADDIDGIGFKRADTIALGMGIAPDSMYRACAGVKYTLSRSATDGHTYLPRHELISKASKLLRIDQSIIENAIVSLALNQSVYLEDIEVETVVYLAPLYQAELSAAQRLINLSRNKFKDVSDDFDKRIESFEREHNITLAPQQRTAVKEALTSGVVVITGGPGTGKTTTINGIINLMDQEGLKIELAAPTGRAAKRMTEATGYDAKTIHRLLEYGFSDDEEEVFNKNENNPIKADAIIIDEMSMVDVILLNNMLKAVLPGTRLIMVGDVDQLPSVGPGNVLRDIIDSNTIEVVKLTEIFRQASESMIVLNAHKINNGELPVYNARDKDFYFDKKSQVEDVLKTVSDLVCFRLPNYYRYHPLKDIQILAPMRKGIIGVNNLNTVLQGLLNPPSPSKKEKSYGDLLFRQGDKVMQIKNNYTIQWELADNRDIKGEGVFNGDMGFIEDIDFDEHTVSVLYDDEKIVEYTFSQLDELELAYAISIHKSQGSEFPAVVLPIVSGPPMLMTRNLLYTAVTRARELVVLVGRDSMISKMIENDHIAGRYSNLKNRLLQISFATSSY